MVRIIRCMICSDPVLVSPRTRSRLGLGLDFVSALQNLGLISVSIHFGPSCLGINPVQSGKTNNFIINSF